MTYKVCDWSIVPASDYRIEAICNQLTLYYLSCVLSELAEPEL